MVKNTYKVVQKPITELIPYVNNARSHSDEQVAQIAASIKEFGFTNPVLIDGENGIIAGHGRVLAARKLGINPGDLETSNWRVYAMGYPEKGIPISDLFSPLAP